MRDETGKNESLTTQGKTKSYGSPAGTGGHSASQPRGFSMQKQSYYRVCAPIAPPNYRNVSGLFETREGATAYLNEILAIDPFADGWVEVVDKDGKPIPNEFDAVAPLSK